MLLETKLKSILKYGLPPLLIVGAIVVVIMAAGQRPQPEEREVITAALLVEAIRPELAVDYFAVRAQGVVQPRTQTVLSSEVTGRIIRLSDAFVAGGFFRADEVLLEIDPSDYEAALLQAEADLAAARARLSDEQARSDQARQDWQRLHGEQREPGELVLRLPQVAGAQASVLAAEAAVMRARRNLQRTLISLPYDGMVRSRQVDVGQFVSVGTALGMTFAVDIAEVRLPMPERELAFLDLPRPGQIGNGAAPVQLRGMVSGSPGVWTGRVVRTEGVVDEGTRLVTAVVEIEDPYGLLGRSRALPLPVGTFVDAEVQGRSARGLVRIPRAALRDGDTIQLAGADDRLEIRRVAVIRTTPDRAYISDEVGPADRIITTAIQTPIPGMALSVRLVDTGADEDSHRLRLLPPDEGPGETMDDDA